MVNLGRWASTGRSQPLHVCLHRGDIFLGVREHPLGPDRPQALVVAGDGLLDGVGAGLERAQDDDAGRDVVLGVEQVERRPASCEAQSPDDGMTCIAPMALATETARWFQPDSCHATARASVGWTPCRRAVRRIIADTSVRLGTCALARASRFLRAARTVASE